MYEQDHVLVLSEYLLFFAFENIYTQHVHIIALKYDQVLISVLFRVTNVHLDVWCCMCLVFYFHRMSMKMYIAEAFVFVRNVISIDIMQ